MTTRVPKVRGTYLINPFPSGHSLIITLPTTAMHPCAQERDTSLPKGYWTDDLPKPISLNPFLNSISSCAIDDGDLAFFSKIESNENSRLTPILRMCTIEESKDHDIQRAKPATNQKIGQYQRSEIDLHMDEVTK